MTRMGVSPSILQQMSASKDIRWLNEKDAADLNLRDEAFRRRLSSSAIADIPMFGHRCGRQVCR